MKNKIFSACAAAVLSAGILMGCGQSNEFNPKREVSVISREQGSGTRDAFVELTGILVKENGKKKDMTSTDALVIDGTQAVISGW